MNIYSLILTGPIIVACQWNTEREKDLLQFGEAKVMSYLIPDNAAQKSLFYKQSLLKGCREASQKIKQRQREELNAPPFNSVHTEIAVVPHTCCALQKIPLQ